MKVLPELEGFLVRQDSDTNCIEYLIKEGLYGLTIYYKSGKFKP